MIYYLFEFDSLGIEKLIWIISLRLLHFCAIFSGKDDIWSLFVFTSSVFTLFGPILCKMLTGTSNQNLI